MLVLALRQPYVPPMKADVTITKMIKIFVMLAA